MALNYPGLYRIAINYGVLMKSEKSRALRIAVELVVLAGLAIIFLWNLGLLPIHLTSPEPPEMKAMRRGKLIVDVHEHISNLDVAPRYLKAMDELGIGKMGLMGSSLMTLTLKEEFRFTGYDENNEELLKIVRAFPDRFEAWAVVNPLDPDKLEKFKSYMERGALGLKLYLGHGYVGKDNQYMFHLTAIDEDSMLPLYAYCSDNHIPVCLHVNPGETKPGFAQEFIAILTQFPDMKLVCPHYMLSFIHNDRLREFLDTFPNLYTDTGFGHFFVKDQLLRISDNPAEYRRIFEEYPDRIMFATDLVLTNIKTAKWVSMQIKVYIDMLSKKRYTTPLVPDKILNGLGLRGELLERVMYKNYEEFLARKPRGTRITREIDWSRMNVKPLERTPGQTFPAIPK